MSDAETPAAPALITAEAKNVSIGDIFLAFLLIGATSFGGGAVAYLRASLVTKHEWFDDKSFLELFSISQSLPGLNTTNMAILAGDRLRGTMGALVAIAGIILPGAIIMTIVGVILGMHGDRPLVTAALHGVAAAALGLILVTFWNLASKTVRGVVDIIFIVLAVVVVNWFHVSVLYALLGLAALGTFIYRPRAKAQEKSA